MCRNFERCAIDHFSDRREVNRPLGRKLTNQPGHSLPTRFPAVAENKNLARILHMSEWTP
jgi:hypothetical protein